MFAGDAGRVAVPPVPGPLEPRQVSLRRLDRRGDERVIARIWHGAVPLPKGQEYLKLTREHAIPDYESCPGNLGAWVLYREDGQLAHLLTLSFWESREAIAGFAGKDIAAAKYYGFDQDYLVGFEPTVIHYELFDHRAPSMATPQRVQGAIQNGSARL
jgi:heme-degrading monooxygenase HmoA